MPHRTTPDRPTFFSFEFHTPAAPRAYPPKAGMPAREVLGYLWLMLACSGLYRAFLGLLW